MEIVKINSDSTFNTETFIGLGNFDGVHKGHRFLINNLVKNAKLNNKKSSVLIFKEHTRNTINQKNQLLLTSVKDRYEILENLGIDYIFEMDFNKNIMKMEPENFLQEFLIKNLKVRGIVVGFDYRFGYKAKGDTELLKEITKANKVFLSIIEPVYYDGEIISSTLIRNYISAGEITKANILLEDRFTVGGTVVHGKKLGSKMGYPTANIELDSNYVTPAFGVYDTNIIVRGKTYKAATSVGTNPTLNEEGIKIEAHILDFNEIIYGDFVKLEFIEYIRPELVFDSIEELFEQIKMDTLIVENRKI